MKRSETPRESHQLLLIHLLTDSGRGDLISEDGQNPEETMTVQHPEVPQSPTSPNSQQKVAVWIWMTESLITMSTRWSCLILIATLEFSKRLEKTRDTNWALKMHTTEQASLRTRTLEKEKRSNDSWRLIEFFLVAIWIGGATWKSTSIKQHIRTRIHVQTMGENETWKERRESNKVSQQVSLKPRHHAHPEATHKRAEQKRGAYH